MQLGPSSLVRVWAFALLAVLAPSGALGEDAGSRLPNDHFSVRWTGTITAPFTGDCTFHTIADDGVRLWVDGRLIIDNWVDQSPKVSTGVLPMEKGQEHVVRLEYFDRSQGAVVGLYWSEKNAGISLVPGPFRGEYYAGAEFDEAVLVRQDPHIDFDWEAASPATKGKSTVMRLEVLQPVSYFGTPGTCPDRETLLQGLQSSFIAPKNTVTVVVDPAESDGAAQIQQLRFRHLPKALEKVEALLRERIPVRLLLKPGVYRDTITMTGGPAMLVIEAEEPGTVIFSGADELTEWQPVNGAEGVFRTSWPYPTTAVPNPWLDMVGHAKRDRYPDLRRELLFVNRQPLRLVDRRDDLTPGTFCVEDGAVYAQAHESVDLRHRNVLAGARPEALYGALVSLTDFTAGLVLKGLVFEHAATAFNGALFVRGRNVLIDDCEFRWNAGYGAQLLASNVWIRNVNAHHNGGLGLTLRDGTNLLFDGGQVSDNYWKWMEAGQESWHSGGIKIAKCHNVLMEGMIAVDNHDHGVWFDVWCEDVTVRNLNATGNRGAGLNCEISSSICVSDSVLVGNGDSGFYGMDVENLRLMRNTIAFNHGPQIKIHESDRKPSTGKWSVRENRIFAPADSRHLLIDWWSHQIAAVNEVPWYERALKSSDFEENLWFHPETHLAFRDPSGKNVDLSSWHLRLSHQEENGNWSGRAYEETLEAMPRPLTLPYRAPCSPTATKPE